MWRLILVSFAFLGWAFFVLSGGSEYEPSPNSLQVALKNEPLFAPPPPVTKRKPVVAEVSVELPPMITRKVRKKTRRKVEIVDLDALEEDATEITGLAALSSASVNGFSVTLASTAEETDFNSLKLGLSGVTGGIVEPDTDDPLLEVNLFDEPVADEGAEMPVEMVAADLRRVTGKAVNMRQGPGTSYEKVGQVLRGARIEVLEASGDGWLRVQVMATGQEGWMADWLVTAQAN